MGEEEAIRENAPLIDLYSSSGDVSVKEPFRKTGNIWSAVAHIITGVIGAGVLSLAWSLAQLGWIAGPVCIILFAVTTYISTYLLSDCYRFPHPQHGSITSSSYMDAVNLYLGAMWGKVCGVLVHVSLYGTTCAYVITSATSIRAILKSNCYHKEGHEAPCKYGDSMYMLVFGLVQVIMSFIPDLHNMVLLSIVAAIMSFTYSSIGLGLGITKVIENGRIMGSVGGVPASNFANKLWLIFQSLGDIAFAYPYTVILLEIQIYSQPIYSAADRWCSRKYPNSGFVNNFYQMKLPLLPAFQLNVLRICFRTTYVISTTGIAIMFPYFNQVLGVLGAFGFWPLTIYFPVEMYFVQNKIEAWSRKWIVLRTFSLVCFLVTVLSLVGSLEGIISEKLS